jgi:3-hydroxymyristoyl/3-hydroxydecanoyl-(acyl carrier protein) dehydratase
LTNVVGAHNDLVKIWPEVLTDNVDESQITLQLLIPKDLDYFAGHFPNAPILAGVVQLHWAVEYAKQYFSLTALDVKNIEVLKFQVVIIPGQELNLTLTQKSNNKVLFSYASDKGQHASGRIVFEEME